ncbi:MAG: hypothetical protein E6J90_16340 [Deltaproteobacteria bacterium]|nr:MAG: hypothetical protein E6J91_16845 [Deltaproteobacteria bacterium]TMQ20286.1 MAG: hypothetical protein E6J90_16340 [Deltaproteobacteria bacterium]
MAEWRRGRAVRAYIDGRRVTDIAGDWKVTRGSVNRWLQWYDADYVDGLRTKIAEGPEPKLTELQRATLTVLIERGPIAAGYQSGVWTGPMIGDLIEDRFGARYHNHHLPRLLHQLGFSVQRPRKRLARADLAPASHVAPRDPASGKKKPASAAALLPSGTRRASGSTGRSIELGCGWASSLA